MRRDRSQPAAAKAGRRSPVALLAVLALLLALPATACGPGATPSGTPTTTPGPGSPTPGTGSPTPTEEAPAMTADLYVSPAGSDDNPGTWEAPLATLKAAKVALRDLLLADPDRDYTVALRGGRYYLQKPEYFNERDSGRGEYGVTYTAYPGETPILYGGFRATGFGEDAGETARVEALHPGAGYKVYRTNVGAGLRFACAYEDGYRLVPARTPDGGYATTESALTDPGIAGFRYPAWVLPDAEEIDPETLKVHLWPGAIGHLQNNWHTNTLQVQALDPDSRTIRMMGAPFWKLTAGNRFFLQGDQSFLDRPGEFWYDRDTGDFLFIPVEPGHPDERDAHVTIPVMKTILGIEGTTPDSLVRNLAFRGLAFRDTDGPETFGRADNFVEEAAILLSYVDGIVVEDCRIANTGVHGILLDDYARHCVIRNNLVEQTGYNGIALVGKYHTQGFPGVETPEDGMFSRDNLVEGNLVRESGDLVGHSHGIYLYLSGHNRILHNTVYRSSSNAITLHGALYGYMEGATWFGIPLTKENYDAFCYTQGNEVRGNDLFDSMYNSSDGGIIGTFGTGRGNVYEENFVHDSTGVPKGGVVGIYMDDSSNGALIRKNVISRIGTPDLEFCTVTMLKGLDIVFENNKAVDCVTDWGMIGVVYTGVEAYSTGGTPPSIIPDTKNTILRRNVVEERNTEEKGRALYHLQRYTPPMIAEADWNLYFATLPFLGVYGNSLMPEWQGWGYLSLDKFFALEDGRLEAHSLFDQDPLFLDPDEDDYRLDAASPAFGLGFEEFDVTDAGIASDSPWRTPMLVTFRLARDGDALAAEVRVASLPGSAGTRLVLWDPYRPEEARTLDLAGSRTLQIDGIPAGSELHIRLEAYDATGALLAQSPVYRRFALDRAFQHLMTGLAP